MHKKIDSILTFMLAICAVAVVVILIRREFFLQSPSKAADQKPLFIKEWRDFLAKGTRVGLAEAPVQLIEFLDFECPFCKTFYTNLKAMQEKYPDQVAIIYVHFPLPMHRFAEPAAKAAECAHQRGRFSEMQDRLFEQQNLFGVKSWSEFAAEVGITDVSGFSICIESTAALSLVIEGKELGARLDVQGTPTLIVNGWKLARPPSIAELEGMIEAVLAGKRPIS